MKNKEVIAWYNSLMNVHQYGGRLKTEMVDGKEKEVFYKALPLDMEVKIISLINKLKPIREALESITQKECEAIGMIRHTNMFKFPMKKKEDGTEEIDNEVEKKYLVFTDELNDKEADLSEITLDKYKWSEQYLKDNKIELKDCDDRIPFYLYCITESTTS